MKSLRFLHSLRLVAAAAAIFIAGAVSAQAQAVADFTDVTPKVDTPPKPTKTPPPKYPADLRRDKVSGLVSVIAVVDEKGTVLAAEASKSTNEAFNGPAVDAVKTWKFEPAKLGGEAVKVRITIPIRFEVEA